jgi:hypothetical protein
MHHDELCAQCMRRTGFDVSLVSSVSVWQRIGVFGLPVDVFWRAAAVGK